MLPVDNGYPRAGRSGHYRSAGGRHDGGAVSVCLQGGEGGDCFYLGFAEVGESGRAVQEEMRAAGPKHGYAHSWPNCLGAVNFYNGCAATFMYHDKPKDLYYPEKLSYITQSGGLGTIIFQMVLQHSVGFNYFVSTGNEADVNFAEVLSYLVGREEVKLIGGYIEGLSKDGALFMEACHEALKKQKLVTFQKVGCTAVGARRRRRIPGPW